MRSFIFIVSLVFYSVLLIPDRVYANNDLSISSQNTHQLESEVDNIRQSLQFSGKGDESKPYQKASVYFSSPPSDTNALEPRVLRINCQSFSMDISAQLNFIVFNADDGSEHYTFVSNNSSYNSSLDISTVFHPQYSRLKVGSNFQFDFLLNPSELVSQEEQRIAEDVETRKLEFYLSDQYLGTLFLGQGSTASDDSSEVDYSNTEVVGYSSVADVGAGLVVRDMSGSLLNMPKVGDLYNNLDGFGYATRIQYTTPDFHGLAFSVSYSGESRGDVVLLYNSHWKDVKVGGAFALTSTYDHFSQGNGVRGNGMNGSASILFPVGISFTFAGGHINSKTPNRDDPSFWYGKLGYQNRFFTLGLTALSIDYGNFKSMYDNVSDAKAYGVQCLQNVNLLNSAFYLGYRHYQPGHAFRNMNIILAGVRYYV